MIFNVTGIGELLIDFTLSGKNSNGNLLFARNPVGAPANVLAANTKLGGKTAFIGKVGKDDFGIFLKNTFDNAAFFGTIYYKLRGKSLTDIRALTKHELEDIIYFSNAKGSFTTAKIGTIPALPTLEKIENCKKNINLIG